MCALGTAGITRIVKKSRASGHSGLKKFTEQLQSVRWIVYFLMLRQTPRSTLAVYTTPFRPPRLISELLVVNCGATPLVYISREALPSLPDSLYRESGRNFFLILYIKRSPFLVPGEAGILRKYVNRRSISVRTWHRRNHKNR